MGMQGKTRKTVLASAERTATSTTTVDTVGWAGMYVYVDVTVDGAAASIVCNVDGYDSVADEAYTLLDSAAIAAVGFTVLKIWPGVTAAANTAANEYLPDRIQINMVHADADAITYSVDVLLLP
jgi:hypothetical protein